MRLSRSQGPIASSLSPATPGQFLAGFETLFSRKLHRKLHSFTRHSVDTFLQTSAQS